jgi:polyisoprenoid-binding protein YceI
MGLPTGTFQLGPDQAQLTVCTTKAGIGARLAHDLVLEARSWHATLTLGDFVGDAVVEATVDAGSLEVIDASGGVRPVSDDDKVEIHGNLTGDRGLRAGEHPAITFRSQSVRGDLPSLSVSGDLTIVGVTQPLSLSVSVDEPGGDEPGETTFAAHATVVQSDYGITPYSALFGAIKVADAVEIVVKAPLPPR